MTTAPNLETVKTRQQATWASGDYSVVGGRIVLTSEQLIDSADLRSGDRVIDVAWGAGNGALGDVERLEVDDESFDAAVSVFGVMFAPDQEACAAELLRVTRQGGTIALTSWTPDGFIGGLLRTVSAHVPPPPGVRPPVAWGDGGRLGALFGAGSAAIRSQRRSYVFRYPSAAAFIEEFRSYYGPLHTAFAALGEDAGALTEDLLALIRTADRRGGETAVAIPATYLETVITRS